MAEAMARTFGEARGIHLEARSAGTLRLENYPADSKAIQVCAEIGVDLSTHSSQGISEALLKWADYVLVMEQEHILAIRRQLPDTQQPLLLLGTFAGQSEISDPVGQWTLIFRRNRNLIRTCVEALLDRLPQHPA